jgi:uncharacterized protein
VFKLSFIPREEKFFDLFEEASANLLESSLALKDLLDDYTDIERKVAHLRDLEHTGDDVTHRIFAALHATFITPIEREDIVQLARSIDDLVDFVENVADTMLLYKIEQPTEQSRTLGTIVTEICREIQAVMPLLRRKETMRKVLPATVTINSLENEGDRVRREGLARLLERPDQVMQFVLWRDVYELLESATDRGEDVANALEAIVISNS